MLFLQLFLVLKFIFIYSQIIGDVIRDIYKLRKLTWGIQQPSELLAVVGVFILLVGFLHIKHRSVVAVVEFRQSARLQGPGTISALTRNKSIVKA